MDGSKDFTVLEELHASTLSRKRSSLSSSALPVHSDFGSHEARGPTPNHLPHRNNNQARGPPRRSSGARRCSLPNAAVVIDRVMAQLRQERFPPRCRRFDMPGHAS